MRKRNHITAPSGAFLTLSYTDSQFSISIRVVTVLNHALVKFLVITTVDTTVV